MKILHITDALPGSHKKWGGAEKVTLKVIDALKEAGVQNEVLCLRPEAWEKSYPFFAIDTVERIIGWRLSSAVKSIFPFDLAAYIKIKKILRRSRPDAVHVHNISEISLAAILAAASVGKKIFVSIYDYWYFCPKRILIKEDNSLCRNFHGRECRTCYEPKRLPRTEKLFLPLRRKIFDHFLNKVDKFIVLSEASAGLLNKYGIAKERLAVIPAPVDSVFENHSGGGKDILFAAWISPHKGLHVILRALPIILKTHPDVRLIVSANGGDKLYRQEIDRMVSSLGLEEGVGIFDKRDLDESAFKNLVNKCALIVIPEQWENMSPVLMFEGILAGIPMVLSRIGGIPEFISDDRLLAVRDDAGDWADRIIWVLNNYEEVKNIVLKEIRPKVQSVIDTKETADKFIKLYSK